MKITGTLLIIAGILFAIFRGYNHFIAIPAEYDQQIGSHWYMFDESSTIEDKSKHMDEYIVAVEKADMSSNSGILQLKPSNSLYLNLNALKSLRGRLNQIKGMDANSFEYQTAIQQITEQEAQGDAVKVIQSCWEKENYYSYYNWMICLGFFVIQLVLVLLGWFLLLD